MTYTYISFVGFESTVVVRHSSRYNYDVLCYSITVYKWLRKPLILTAWTHVPFRYYGGFGGATVTHLKYSIILVQW